MLASSLPFSFHTVRECIFADRRVRCGYCRELHRVGIGVFRKQVSLVFFVLQTELFAALHRTRMITGTAAEAKYTRCGRTDKGVSAVGQV